jgi:hypothetical protein
MQATQRRDALPQGQVATSEQSFNKLLLHAWCNPIQRKLLQLLRPIAKKYLQRLLDGTLHVWLKKSLLSSHNVNTSYCYEKLIQMLVCLHQAEVNPKTNKVDYIMPLDLFIQAVVKYIQGTGGSKPKDTLVNISRWTKNSPPLSPTQTMSETLLNSFLYAYISSNPWMFDPLMDERADEKAKQLN